MNHILHVVGARPNFMKAAPVLAALERQQGFRQTLVHTGQHYDANMSEIFFQQLGIPEPDFNLEVGSGSHAQQTAQILSRLEPVVLEQKPDLVLVYGDVNSTVAAALVCTKIGIPVGHVEAGLRSFDRTMPEEINRLLTDQVADLLFTPSIDGNQNLEREGIDKNKVYLVGNVMIDTLVRLLPKAGDETLRELIEGDGQAQSQPSFSVGGRLPFELVSGPYALVTLHRPSNVDDPEMLREIITTLNEISAMLPVILPIHPRTRQRLSGLRLDLDFDGARLKLIDPVGYLQFLALQRRARLVITDSGGIQEETTFLGIPCLTVRENTERPVTVTLGTNVLVGQDMMRLREEVERILAGAGKKGSIPPLWDGRASERIAEIIKEWLGPRND
ncbi:MAG: UDP-N-acetylglucosamine 2-epimerase (non-hydrolyzing) [bacterium]|nr:UDP-N-acetylglucosamine 2-epimerase (non-hydrolyzing) [bacterium]